MSISNEIRIFRCLHKIMRSVLVTGSHRSGSTWVGKILSNAPQTRYIQEPFNIAIKKYASPIEYWFYYLEGTFPKEEKEKVINYIESFRQPKIQNTIASFKRAKTLKGKYYALGDAVNRFHHRSIYKDPLAFFSAPYFYEHLNFDVVVCVRHPAAFVASLKNKQWEFDFNHLLMQEKLMQHLLYPFAEEIREFANKRPALIDQGILLWNIIYKVAFQYQKEYGKKWIFVTNEDLSLRPIQEFKSIFEKLNLSFTTKVEEAIQESTKASEKSKLKRDSQKNIHSWKERLTTSEIEAIKKGTQDTWPLFYEEDTW